MKNHSFVYLDMLVKRFFYSEVISLLTLLVLLPLRSVIYVAPMNPTIHHTLPVNLCSPEVVWISLEVHRCDVAYLVMLESCLN